MAAKIDPTSMVRAQRVEGAGSDCGSDTAVFNRLQSPSTVPSVHPAFVTVAASTQTGHFRLVLGRRLGARRHHSQLVKPPRASLLMRLRQYLPCRSSVLTRTPCSRRRCPRTRRSHPQQLMLRSRMERPLSWILSLASLKHQRLVWTQSPPPAMTMTRMTLIFGRPMRFRTSTRCSYILFLLRFFLSVKSRARKELQWGAHIASTRYWISLRPYNM